MDLITILREKRVKYKMAGDHIYMTCFKCGKEDKLYFNTHKFIGDCKYCGEIIYLKSMLEHLGVRIPLVSPGILSLRERLKGLTDDTLDKLNEIFLSVELPPCMSANKSKAAKEYLESRGLRSCDIQNYNLKYCYEGPYFGRIIIPIYDRNFVLKGFQGRSLDKYAERKYLFSKGMKKSEALFGIHVMNENPSTVVLTEGVFPAITFKGVATFGKSFSKGQLDLLLNFCKSNTKMILLWDSDSWTVSYPGNKSPAETTAKLLSKYFETRAIQIPQLVSGESGQPDSYPKYVVNQWIRKCFDKPHWKYIPTIREHKKWYMIN